MIPLTDEEKEAQKIMKFATYVKKNFVQMKIIKKMQKVRDHCHCTRK